MDYPLRIPPAWRRSDGFQLEGGSAETLGRRPFAGTALTPIAGSPIEVVHRRSRLSRGDVLYLGGDRTKTR
jgi:hypothetical protein